MKKKYFLNLITLYLIVNCYGQASADYKPEVYLDNDIFKQLSDSNSGTADIVSLKDIQPSAIHDFQKTFKNAGLIKWTILKNGYCVYASNSNTAIRISYDEHGTRTSVIKYYYEETLKPRFRKFLNTAYPSYKIFLVTEVLYNKKKAFVIKLEGITTWKTIKVVGNKVEEIENFIKNQSDNINSSDK